MSWLSVMNDWVLDLLEPHGLGIILLVLFLVAFMESSFFPVPPDIILMAFVLEWREYFLIFAVVATVGSVLGGLFGHWIGKRGGRPLAQKYLNPKKMARAEYYFEKWGAWAVGIAGFSPIPYKVFTITAGALKMERNRFLIASSISRGSRFFLEAILLFTMGSQIRDFIESPEFNILTLVGVVGLAAIFYHRAKKAEKERLLEGSEDTDQEEGLPDQGNGIDDKDKAGNDQTLENDDKEAGQLENDEGDQKDEVNEIEEGGEEEGPVLEAQKEKETPSSRE